MDENIRTFEMPRGKYQGRCPDELKDQLERKGYRVVDGARGLHSDVYTQICFNEDQIGFVSKSNVKVDVRDKAGKDLAKFLETFRFSDVSSDNEDLKFKPDYPGERGPISMDR